MRTPTRTISARALGWDKLTQRRLAVLQAGPARQSDRLADRLVDDAQLSGSLELASALRAGGINTEVQLEPRKLAKQFQYADRSGIRFMVLAGAEEAARGVVTIKDLREQRQFEVARADLVATLAQALQQPTIPQETAP